MRSLLVFQACFSAGAGAVIGLLNHVATALNALVRESHFHSAIRPASKIPLEHRSINWPYLYCITELESVKSTAGAAQKHPILAVASPVFR